MDRVPTKRIKGNIAVEINVKVFVTSLFMERQIEIVGDLKRKITVKGMRATPSGDGLV